MVNIRLRLGMAALETTGESIETPCDIEILLTFWDHPWDLINHQGLHLDVMGIEGFSCEELYDFLWIRGLRGFEIFYSPKGYLNL